MFPDSFILQKLNQTSVVKAYKHKQEGNRHNYA